MKKLILLYMLVASTTSWASLENVREFGSNPGNLTMKKFTPSVVDNTPRPLVVALHGCTQSAKEYQDRSGWSYLAEKQNFFVIYPEQKSINNPMLCFNWAGEYGDITNLKRGKGENQSIISMIEKMKQDHNIDSNRIYLTGFSAGGAFASVMLALYPDVFAAGAVMAGIPYKCATDLMGSMSCMNSSRSMTAEQWAKLVKDATGGKFENYPPISIWFGTNDNIVNPQNSFELAKQWSPLHSIDTEATPLDYGDKNDHYFYKNEEGKAVITMHKINGMGHAISIDTSGEFKGGSTGSYAVNAGIHSTYVVAQEWGIIDGYQPVVIKPRGNDGSVVDSGNSDTVNSDITDDQIADNRQPTNSSDSLAPKLHINTNIFMNGSPVNGNIIITGKAFGINEIKEIVISVTPMSVGWGSDLDAEVVEIRVPYTSNWRYMLDTSTLDNMKSYIIALRAVDTLGNDSDVKTRQFTLLKF